MRNKFSENLLKASLAVAIFLLLAIAGENYRQFQIYSESQKLIISSHEIQAGLQKLGNHISETETAHRLYIVTNDPALLAEYNESKHDIFKQIETLRKLIQNDSVAQVKIDSIYSIIHSRITSLDTILPEQESSEITELDKKRLQNSEKLVKDVMILIKEIIFKEGFLLKEKENLGDEKHKITPLLLLLTVLFSIAIFVLSFYMLFTYLRKVKANNAKLRINNMIYEQAEQISNSGHWYYEPGTNRIVFSNNLYKLLGHSPNSFEPSLKKYINHIKENERPILISKLKKLKQEGKIKATDITIIDAAGNEKCLRLVARIVVDEMGHELVIGANKDLTKEIDTNKKLSKLNEELSIQNDIFKNAESIAMIGSYSYDLEKRTCEFSDNLYKILGHKPQSFEANEQILLNHVYLDDEDEFIKSISMDAIMDDNVVHRFRLIDKNQNLKHILAKRKIFQSKSNKILIVTFKDISEEVLISLKLEEKNDELIKINAELESFNHIASHDLQEPLRKIQTFISILLDMEDLHLTDNQEEYLQRINSAANRMQNLVIDLLSFSRASKGDKIFKSTNLSTLLGEAIQELSTDIDAKDGTINYDNLPNAEVIPFQFQQLFVNLIGNSLKYSRKNKKPNISIKTKKVDAKDLLSLPNFQERELIKITFEDNGIGFEQQYAEKIFTLFQRLHHEKQYTGTGIGLAICRKILQNHKGIIYAEGRPEIGTKFTLLFPKRSRF